MKVKMIYVLTRSACIGAILLTACSTVQLGHDFNINVFEARVQRGVTTQVQVRQWLGAPTNTGIAVQADDSLNEEWTYYFAQGSPPSMSDAKFKILQVRFDTQGKVVSYSWSGDTGVK